MRSPFSYIGFTPRTSVALGVLALAGLAGNYLSIPLFFGVDFLLGSIAVMIVLRLFGMGPGVMVAVIAGSYTYVLWNHPYALLILTAEALFVGAMLRRGHGNLVLLDALYWVVIGTPLVWLFYSGVMQFDVQATLLVVLKQSVNGILNTVLASLLIEHAPARAMGERHSGQASQFPPAYPLQHHDAAGHRAGARDHDHREPARVQGH